MSKYYNINGLGKVRVSDHEPNNSLNGASELNLYIVDACGSLISVEAQIEGICEKRDLNISIFKQVIEDFKDGSYDKNFFKLEENENEVITTSFSEGFQNIIAARKEDIRTTLNTITLVNSFGAELRKEIKEISERTGISQSKIKKHFNIR